MKIFEDLDVAITEKDIEEVRRLLVEIKQEIDTGNVEVVEHVATPANLTVLQARLCDELGVNRRLLQLRNRVPNAVHRSSLFVQAMMNAVGYL